MPDYEGDILKFIGRTGPIIPNQLAKFLGCDILIASAHLSDLVSRNKVFVSDLKIGSSPLYFIPGQEGQLVRFSQHLNARDQETFNQLQAEKVLREQDADLFTKISLRNIKDFSRPLKVTVEGATELFWKWYTVSDADAEAKVYQLLASRPVPVSPVQTTAVSELAPVVPLAVDVQPPELVVTAPSPIQNGVVSRFVEMHGEAIGFAGIPETVFPSTTVPVAEKPSVLRGVKRTFAKLRGEDVLFPRIESYLKKRNIVIESKETIRKGAEVNLIVKVPTDIGSLTYFCKVKDKKRCDDKDLSSAYMEGQVKKLPTLLLYTNELHKKAEELLQSGMFANLQALRLK